MGAEVLPQRLRVVFPHRLVEFGQHKHHIGLHPNACSPNQPVARATSGKRAAHQAEGGSPPHPGCPVHNVVHEAGTLRLYLTLENGLDQTPAELGRGRCVIPAAEARRELPSTNPLAPPLRRYREYQSRSIATVPTAPAAAPRATAPSGVKQASSFILRRVRRRASGTLCHAAELAAWHSATVAAMAGMLSCSRKLVSKGADQPSHTRAPRSTDPTAPLPPGRAGTTRPVTRKTTVRHTHMNRCIPPALFLAVLTLGPAGCGGPTAQQPTPTPASIAPDIPVPTSAAAPTPAQSSWTMPDFVGSNLQEAQDTIQRLTNFEIALTTSHDATGAGREQVVDRSWRVCSQNIRPGATITNSSMIDFGAVKLSERC